MNIDCCGVNYYLDEEKFKEAMSKPAPPLKMDEVIAIQHQMRELELDLMARIKQTAAPDPYTELQRYIDELLESKNHENR